MKRLAAVSLLCLLPSCKALGAAFSGSTDPEADAQARQAGETAGGAVTMVTGNPILGGGVALIVTGAAGIWLKLRKKPKAAEKPAQPTA